MANTHDYIIDNATGSVVRADLNTLFLEIEASNAGDSAPSNVAAGKLWMDTTTNTLKYYTGAQWVSIGRQVKGSANNTHITGNINPIADTAITGVSTVFTTQAKVGDKLVVSGETRTITAIADDTHLTVDVATTNTADDDSPEIHPAAFVVTDDGGGIDLLVDTDGKVGVNCATPGAQVDVRGTTGTGSGTAGVLRLSTAELTVADGDQLGRIEFVAPLEASGTDANLVGASIYAEADDTFASDNNATEIVFATGASEAAAEKMRIASDGKIGVNCSDPNGLVDIRGDAGTGAASAGVLTLSTAETSVRVGTVDQLGRIDFQAPKESGGTDALLVGASIWAECEEDFAGDNNSTGLVFATGTTATATEKMRIDQDGNVGIGTAHPSGIVDIEGSTPVLRVATTANGTPAILELVGRSSDGNPSENKVELKSIAVGSDEATRFGIFVMHNSAGDMTERLSIMNSGNVGIGTTNIGYKLEVDGTFAHRGITDMSRRILKENIEVVSDENLIEKFKELPLYRYNFKPDVDREELKDLAFREFGEEVDGEWVWDKWDEIFPNGHEAGRMWDCSDPELKAFLDEKAEEIRGPQRDEKYDKNSLNFGLIADDAILAEKFPELVDYRKHPDTNELESWGIRSTSYIGMLHGVIKELVERVETLENA